MKLNPVTVTDLNRYIKQRVDEGCICVDMECSAIAALAKFRGKEVFQFFYAADNLASAEWDMRSLNNNDRLDDKEKIGLLAINFAESLNNTEKGNVLVK